MSGDLAPASGTLPAGQPSGLSAAEVAQRRRAGQVNIDPNKGARPLSQIIRANTMTVFNLVIGVLWVLMLLTAPIQDSLFGFIIIINSAIGIVQEWRASQTLAKLSLLGAARPCVRRDGQTIDVPSSDVVVDDVILLRPGDQIVVDGPVLDSAGMQVDESLLTGEADPVAKGPGDDVLSGSFVVAGQGMMRAALVGSHSYAGKLAAQARVYTKSKSELLDSIMRFVRVMTYVLIPVAIWLFISQLRADPSWQAAISGTVAGVVTMIPEGLVLLTSVAMAVSVVRLGRQRALVQEMPAVETLARVDVICVDKTGTLTEPGMSVQQVVPLRAGPDAPGVIPGQVDPALARVLGGLGDSEETPNPTLAAVAAAFPAGSGVRVVGAVPFGSDRKWSAAELADGESGATAGPTASPTWWMFGAPEMVCAADPQAHADTLTRSGELAATGARVLVLARCLTPPEAAEPVPGVVPEALVVINQTLRSDAAQTVAYFAAQDVAVKVISGDNPATVAAIAAQAGVPDAAATVDGRDLPTDQQALADVLEGASVFGRVTPAQKQAMVGALQSRGHVVAMTGDGVNDVLALKLADLGIAMGSGAGATRSVAQIVLLDNKFSVMPSVVAEGRRVLGNIERVSDLFLNKSFYATVLAVMTSIASLPFPFLPRHLSVVTFLTIGTPAFFLALMPNTERFRPGFFRRVLTLAVPSGIICAVAAMSSYGVALRTFEAAVESGVMTREDALGQSRVAATITLFLAAWWVMYLVAKPMNLIRAVIVWSMAAGFLVVLFFPPLSRFFALSLGADKDGLVALAFGAVAMVLISLARRISEGTLRREQARADQQAQSDQQGLDASAASKAGPATG